MKLIIGLGNPTKRYQKTRHNIGFMVLDKLSVSLNVSFDKEKNGGLYTKTIVNGVHLILLKPQRYMNLSGEVLLAFMKYYKIELTDLLIVHDDLDLKLGQYKLKVKGGSGGHNGLKDIEHYLKTQNYQRLKIGIANHKGFEASNYVLKPFSFFERKRISLIIDKAVEIAISFIDNDYLYLMNKYNQKEFTND